MSHNIHGSMIYSYEQPMWHAITKPSIIPMGAEEILDTRFNGGFPIHLRPVTVELNGGKVETGDFAIVRGNSPYDPEERVFGYCSDRYLPLQPREICQSFDTNVGEPAETMAFLGKGEDMFISWKREDFEVKVGDAVTLYNIVRCGFDTLKGARLFSSIHRPVCNNTVVLAQGWADKNTDGQGKGNIWKGKGVNHHLLRDLGFWMKHVQQEAEKEAELLKGFFGKLATVPIKDDVSAQTILKIAYPDAPDVSPYYPVELRPAKQEKVEDFNLRQEGLRDGIFELFAGAGTAITPDYWGMLNATSEFFCHVQPSKKPIAESVMFGGRQKNMQLMVDTLSTLSR